MNDNNHKETIDRTLSFTSEMTSHSEPSEESAAKQTNEKSEDMSALKQLLLNFRENKLNMNYIKPETLPDIDLYMDQVTTFMDSHLSASKRYADDKILTKTMINNYAKNNLLPPPEKKKYSKDHLLLLTFIYYLKNMLSMSDIQTLLEPIKNEFFQNSDQLLSLENIYREIFNYEFDIQDTIMNDILAKYEQSRGSFPTLQDNPEKKNTLQDFTFICMLCYDIFLKKQLVEQIIDTSYKPDTSGKKHK